MRYIREQSGDVERFVADRDLRFAPRLVRIACSQALALDFLPREIAAYRANNFRSLRSTSVFDHERAMATLGA